MFKGYKAGAVDFLYKPVNPELLRVKVGLFVELYRKTQSLEREIEERHASELKVRELNSQLMQNNMQLKAANEELDRFAYIASHDLQEPLRKIRMFSDLILQKKPNYDEVDKHIVKITNATERMQQLVNDLLRFSRHSVSKGDFIEVNLNGIVQEAVKELDHQIQQTNAQVLIDPLPAVYAIPTLMQQVFYNLIGNAIKFRKKDGTPQVHIYAKQEVPPKEMAKGNGDINYYNIYVKDNGIGFEPKYLEDIFIVFKRLHSYHEIEGSGIGLSICKKIMEQHSGFITAVSEVNNGATFIIGLPRVK
jgi:light-regulated signal transduction histidine kinase (bacteriophytochrome)